MGTQATISGGSGGGPVTHYDGFATMYMRMPMSTSSLPIQGQCYVDDRRITLRFPFTGVEFELPQHPSVAIAAHLARLQQQQASGNVDVKSRDTAADFDFKIRGARGDLVMSIRYMPELKAFTGIGRQEDDHLPVLTFCFYSPDSLLSRLPKI